VMGVPAHDERDWAFARRYGLPVVPVIGPGRDADDETTRTVLAGGACWTGDGTMLRTPAPPYQGAYAEGMSVAAARASISEYAEKTGFGRRVVRYHMRDWVFARQRYWGEPVPLIHWDNGLVTALKPEE